MVQLQQLAGNAAVAHLVQRSPVTGTDEDRTQSEGGCGCGGGCSTCATVARLPDQASAGAGDGAAGDQTGHLVDQAPAPGQMTKDAFLTELRAAVTDTASTVLAPTGWTANDCPDLARWFDHYQSKDAAHVERALRRYAPDAAQASSARDYIPAVCSRVRRAVLTWALTGEVTGVPDDLTASGDTPPVPDAAAAGAPPGTEPGAAGVQRAARDGGTATPAGAAAAVGRLGAGSPLDPSVGARLGTALGSDLSGVRVHDGPEAAALASALGARAFAYGNHVGFDAGEYRPGTPTGDAILAHELAHVEQQKHLAQPTVGAAARSGEALGDGDEGALEVDADRAATGAIARLWGVAGTVAGGVLQAPGRLRAARPRLQRCRRASSPSAGPTAAPGDYLIEGLSRGAAGRPDSIFFERNQGTIPAGEKAKVPTIANPPAPASAANPLGLFGYASEDETNPAALAQSRMDAVAAEIAAQSPPGAAVPTKTNRHGDTAGRIDYREVRMVETVRSTTAVAPPVSAQPACQPGVSTVVPCTPQQTATLNTGVVQGANWVQQARDKINNGDPAALALISQLFTGGAPVSAAVKGAIVANLDLWKAHLATLNQAGKHECRQCGKCSHEPAYNNGVGAASKMTLCPIWLDGGVQEAIATMVHEAGHGTAGVETVDHAYGNTRKLHALTQAEALKNTDSYVLLIRSLNGHAVTLGPTTPDNLGALSTAGANPERNQAQRAIAWMENHLTQAFQLTADVYTYLKHCRDANKWLGGDWGHTGMGKVSTRLPGLSAPGAINSAPGPTVADQQALAAIHDRYNAMFYAIYGKPVTVVKGATDSWAAGPGNTVTLSPAFFALTPRQQLVKLLELVIRATPGISGGLVPGYLALIDDMRIERRIGTP